MTNLKNELERINGRYLSEHFIYEADVKHIQDLIDLITNTRADQPQKGDIVQYTNEHGDYYGFAHIEAIDKDGIATICEQPYTPFIYAKGNDFSFSTSGGAWTSLNTYEFEYVGKADKKFCDWGNCGACANGAIDFIAKVNVWRYKAPNQKFGGYSTEKYNKMYISFNDNKEMTRSNYIIFGNGHAWETQEDYELFKTTYKAVEFDGYQNNSKVIFYYKEQSYLISFEEWQKLELKEDTRQCNGIIKVKVQYDNENKIIKTYRYTNGGEWGKDAPELYELARKGV